MERKSLLVWALLGSLCWACDDGGSSGEEDAGPDADTDTDTDSDSDTDLDCSEDTDGDGYPPIAATWEWKNPTPTGNGLSDVEFDGAVGYAIGDKGTLLKSEDGGDTWGSVLGLGSASFSSLAVCDDGNTVIALGGTWVYRSDDGGETWTAHDFDTPLWLYSMGFSPDCQTGFVGGEEGNLWKTEDGGACWSVVPGISEFITDIEVVDASTAILISNDVTTWLSSGARTTDGGATWTHFETTPTEGVVLRDVAMLDATVGYIVGDLGTLLRTDDGGETWTAQDPGVEGDPASVQPLDADSAVAVVTAMNEAETMTTSTLIATDDGGNTWTVIGTVENLEAYAIHFPGGSATDGFLVGHYDASLLKTDDGGATWTNAIEGPRSRLDDVTFPGDGEVGFAVGENGTIFKTEDGGDIWVALDAGPEATEVDFECVHFPVDAETGWAVGGAYDEENWEEGPAAAFKTEDGGDTWVAQDVGGFTGQLSDVLFPSDETTGYAVGSEESADYELAGVVLKTEDGGATWTRLTLPAGVANLISVSFPEGTEVGWASGYPGMLLETEDGGDTWTAHDLGAPEEWIMNVAFPESDEVGYALIRSGVLMKTEDGGDTWAPTIEDAGALWKQFFVDDSIGFLVADVDDMSGLLLKTEDGGGTWVTLNMPVNASPESIAFFADAQTGFAVGDEGAILKTTTGGE